MTDKNGDLALGLLGLMMQYVDAEQAQQERDTQQQAAIKVPTKTPIPGITLDGQTVYEEDFPEPPEGAMTPDEIERWHTDARYRHDRVHGRNN